VREKELVLSPARSVLASVNVYRGSTLLGSLVVSPLDPGSPSSQKWWDAEPDRHDDADASSEPDRDEHIHPGSYRQPDGPSDSGTNRHADTQYDGDTGINSDTNRHAQSDDDHDPSANRYARTDRRGADPALSAPALSGSGRGAQ